MSIELRIGVLYATPVLAVLVALLYFLLLWRRMRRGAMSRSRALRRFGWMLVLPIAVVLVVWATGELASYLAVAGARYAFDVRAAAQFLWSLAPLAVYVAAPILLLYAALAVVPVPRRYRRWRTLG